MKEQGKNINLIVFPLTAGCMLALLGLWDSSWYHIDGGSTFGYRAESLPLSPDLPNR